MRTVAKVVAGIVLAPIVLLVAGIGGCEAMKAYYDRQVRGLCGEEGGVTVYEQVRITSKQASDLGTVAGYLGVPSEALARADSPVFSRLRSVTLQCCEPTLMRHEEEIVRRLDGRVIARAVRFSRSGGDFPFTGSHPSSFSCPEDQPKFYQERSRVYQLEGMKQ